jgi:hypothetical protein
VIVIPAFGSLMSVIENVPVGGLETIDHSPFPINGGVASKIPVNPQKGVFGPASTTPGLLPKSTRISSELVQTALVTVQRNT